MVGDGVGTGGRVDGEDLGVGRAGAVEVMRFGAEETGRRVGERSSPDLEVQALKAIIENRRIKREYLFIRENIF